MTTSPDITRGAIESGMLLAGKYRIEHPLGTGGFATVYAARHESISTLRVAIKVLHAEHIESDVTRRRFKREAELAAALQSRFIVRVLDAGELDDRRPFIAMEFVDGRPLDALLKQCGRLAPRDVATFAEGILRALEVAHSAGVVHRDLKPANIFAVEEDGESAYARVLDFGIAKAVQGSTNAGMGGTHTIAGQVVCTPEYAAPELLTGEVTPQVDLYALGHLMAELLDGRAPYDIGEHPMLVAAEHLRPDPVPLGRWTRATPLAPIIARACAKSKQERYPSAHEMLVDLKPIAQQLRATDPAPPLQLATPYTLAGALTRAEAAAGGQPSPTTGIPGGATPEQGATLAGMLAQGVPPPSSRRAPMWVVGLILALGLLGGGAMMLRLLVTPPADRTALPTDPLAAQPFAAQPDPGRAGAAQPDPGQPPEAAAADPSAQPVGDAPPPEPASTPEAEDGFGVAEGEPPSSEPGGPADEPASPELPVAEAPALDTPSRPEPRPRPDRPRVRPPTPERSDRPPTQNNDPEPATQPNPFGNIQGM